MTSPQLGNSWRSTLLRICSQPPCPANLIMANDQPCKSVHKLGCERGGLSQKTHVTARQLGQVPTQFLAPFDVHLIAWITTRCPPRHQHDPVGMRLERVRIEVD